MGAGQFYHQNEGLFENVIIVLYGIYRNAYILIIPFISMAETIPLSVLVDEELDTKIRERSAQKKMSIADVVRQALIRYFEGEN